jgi:hypothetical protein
MTEPSWQKLITVKVAARPEGLWNMVFPYVSGPRLLRITVIDNDNNGAIVSKKWKLENTEECGPDGSLRDQQQQRLIATAPRGAMVGKVGGSTADLPDTSAAATGGPYGGRKVFASGSCTVVVLSNTDSGPLFLTINDSPDRFCNHAGELWVLIEEAPL